MYLQGSGECIIRLNGALCTRRIGCIGRIVAVKPINDSVEDLAVIGRRCCLRFLIFASTRLLAATRLCGRRRGRGRCLKSGRLIIDNNEGNHQNKKNDCANQHIHFYLIRDRKIINPRICQTVLAGLAMLKRSMTTLFQSHFPTKLMMATAIRNARMEETSSM